LLLMSTRSGKTNRARPGTRLCEEDETAVSVQLYHRAPNERAIASDAPPPRQADQRRLTKVIKERVAGYASDVGRVVVRVPVGREELLLKLRVAQRRPKPDGLLSLGIRCGRLEL
jgi:hypothetical protein